MIPTEIVRGEICRQASSCKEPPCSVCSFILGTEKEPLGGGECVIYALQDHSGRAVGMRIYRDHGESSTYLLQNEIKNRKKIGMHQINRFQKLLGFGPTQDSVVRVPFVLLEWAHGRPLVWTDALPSNLFDRERIIFAVANTTMDLLRVQESGPAASEYVNLRIRRKISRALRHEYRGGNIESCQKQQDLAEAYLIPELENAPYVLVHGDMSPNNIIVDESNNIQSLIDLGWAEMVPLQFAAVYPRFLTHEPLRDGPGLENVSSFDWNGKNTHAMKLDRQCYLKCVKERAQIEGGYLKQYYNVLARADEVRRFWWFKAISQADVHQAMVSCDWIPDGGGM